MRIDALHRRVSQNIDEMMDAVGEVLPAKMPKRLEGASINLVSFIRRLNAVTEPFDIFNERSADREIPEGLVVVSGLWLPKDELPENGSSADIRLLWHTHPNTKRVQVTQMKWDRRRFYFWQRVAHELIHRHQSAHRSDASDPRTFRVNAEDRTLKELQAYYGNFDEIEAYAHDTAMEFCSWYPDAPFRDARVQAEQVGGPVEPTWTTFLDAFDGTHPAALVFKRKTRSWWDAMRQAPTAYDKLCLPRLV